MGNKSGRIRQHFLHLLTVFSVTLFLGLQSCIPPKVRVDNSMTPQRQLAHHRYALEMGGFETVILQGKRILQESEAIPPADIALYALGETYAHHAFEGKDYGLSKYYFEKLVKTFPNSPLAWEARTFISLYENFAVQENMPEPLAADQNPFWWTAEPPGNERFNEAIERNERIMKQSGENAPADAALYNLGLVYAHIDNPAKDFLKARRYFEELIMKFPGSPLSEEAKVWIGLFATIEKMQQIDIEIEQQRKQLSK